MRRLTALFLALASVLACAAPAPASAPVPRETITLAYADDPSRVALLWGITTGKVTSPLVDVKVSFLPLAQIIPAGNTKQFDAIEATPLAIARTAGGEPGFLLLSSGLVNLGGTLIVTGASSAIRTTADLKGRTVAVPSLGATFVQEARFVMAKRHGLNVDLRTGDVKFAETPPEATLQLLKDNRLDAAVTTQLLTYRFKDSPDVRVLSTVVPDVVALTGQRSLNSVVVTYKDRATSKGRALAELQRLLVASRAHLRANQAEIVKAVAAEKKVDEAYLAWFFTAYDLAAGPVSATDKNEIVAAWEAARSLGDIQSVPRVDDVIFTAP